jgi:thymidylate synthase
MRQYRELVQKVLTEGELRSDRTGVGTLSIFGAQTRYDLRDGFPLLTTKKVNFDAVKWELLWFLSGSTNVRDLHKVCRGCDQHLQFRDHKGVLQTVTGRGTYEVCKRCKGTKIDPGSRIWDDWAKEDGSLGPIYSRQWRSWPTGERVEGTERISTAPNVYVWNEAEVTIDQIQLAIDTIKTKPDSRRIIVSAWNVAEIEEMALPPCHALFQFYVGFGPDGRLSDEAPREVLAEAVQPGWTLIVEGLPYYVERVSDFMHNKGFHLHEELGKPFKANWANKAQTVLAAPGRTVPAFLDCQLYQRSGDLALGVPFNIASYALLTQMIAQECGVSPRYFIHTFGDVHIYTNHVEGLKRQLDRACRPLPMVSIAPKPFFEIGEQDIQISNYNPHPFIKFEVAV